MTRAERQAAMAELANLGFRGEIESSPSFKAHDDGGEDAPWISEWLSDQPCPFPELLRDK